MAGAFRAALRSTFGRRSHLSARIAFRSSRGGRRNGRRGNITCIVRRSPARFERRMHVLIRREGRWNGTMTVHSGSARVMAIAFHGSVAPFCRGNAARPANFSWRAGWMRRFRASDAFRRFLGLCCGIHGWFVFTPLSGYCFRAQRTMRSQGTAAHSQISFRMASNNGSSARRNARAQARSRGSAPSAKSGSWASA